jgi:hypothetical protein
VKRHVTANADARQRTADEEIVHDVLSTESRNDELWLRDPSGRHLSIIDQLYWPLSVSTSSSCSRDF